ncbi:MAG: hypothetical protein EB075_06980, partial [Bacteroidetes bacterium]|nr:hypothetical protein [Bacteroidota bacterium]
MVMNAYDASAMEAALTLVEAAGTGSIEVITVGPASASETIRKALAMGAQSATHLVVPDDAALDAMAFAKILASHLADADHDVILCGKQSQDMDAGLTGPMLATLGSTLLYLAIFLFGLTITATISWLDVIDRVGSMTLNLGSTVMIKSRKWIEERKQELATRERLESRKKVLDIHIEKERKRVPPTITAPPPKKPAPSPRVQKEKQGSLFESASVKELPAIGLLDAW